MEVNAILQSAASISPLSVRPFLAAFVVAMLARFSEYVGAVPTWFIADMTLIIMGILAGLEIIARKDADVRMFLDEVDGILKAGVSLIVSFTLVDAESAALLMTLTGDPATSSIIPTIVSGVWSVMTAVGTWFVSGFRKVFIEPFTDADEDDDLGIQGVFSWGEDIFAVTGVALAVIIPLVVIILSLLTFLGLYIVQKVMERRIEQSKIACVHCQHSIFPSATICHKCKKANPRPVQTGYFGQPLDKLAVNHAMQRFQLVTRKLCPSCATRLKEKAVQQTCPTCATKTFKSREAVEEYLAVMQKKLPGTMVISGLFGLIPVVGLVPGIIYYRLSLISGVRRYVPRKVGCLTRWGVRLLNLILLLLQPVPLLGALTLPLMCFLNFHIYKTVLQREVNRQLKTMPASLSPS
jgi:hypothetical protein